MSSKSAIVVVVHGLWDGHKFEQRLMTGLL